MNYLQLLLLDCVISSYPTEIACLLCSENLGKKCYKTNLKNNSPEIPFEHGV